MNCLIVDDNKIARTTLKKLISLDPSLVLVSECSNATEAYIKILEQPIDLLFLDIEMPGMTGMELAQSLGQKRPLIIFTTSNRDYAAEAFDLDVIDFITKPVTTVRFLQSVEKAREFRKTKILPADLIEEDFIFIRDSGTVRRLQLDNILYLEAQGDYVKIYVANQFYNIHTTLKSVEEKLPASVFLRVHRSFIINVSKIDTLEGGTLIIHKNLVPVSDAYRAALNKRMQIL
ncbi:DNA-binding response regulator, LytR/AlgR family [Pedobacter steynii]|uniref:DNA-binding response regulator, LytR/AlgR family n=1 Tax=Pedobacter steynii TaxID=430522 RepID=A0A1G9SC05_9SPHI|nr:LytTR family DNA-binding domain-containing protein [Pedobacter steynii]NQX37474.1 response regulator transcription factor [Pedobacter steynii]SDM32911.1 DNA-binding response regulator, LytR/AlgR family [Pedobacter steynii]